MKILSTMRAGRVVRQSLYSPKDPNPNCRRRAISIPKEEKQRANLKTSYEKLLMLMCANFSPGDWWVTLTYDDEHLPETREASQPYWRKFMRWYRKYRKDNKEPLSYVYCTQLTTRGGGRRLHHHMVMRFEDDADEERIRSLWKWGEIVHIRKLKSFEEILDKAHYMCREPRELGIYIPGEQMWTASRGLVRPKFEYAAIDSDAVDISVPVGCTQLSDPVQLPGYGGYEPTGQEDESWNADAGREGTIKGYRTGTVVTISAEGSEMIRMNSYATGMFANMEKLTTVTGWELLDGTNVETTHGAFARDYALTSVDLSGVQMPNWSGGNGMFNYCEALQTVKLPRYGIPKLTAVESMFDGCTNLKEADLGRGLTLVGKKMFYKCLNLQQIQGLEAVSAIGDRAFVYTPALAAVDLRDRNVKTIGESACRLSGMEDSVALTSAPDVGQMATRSKRWDAEALAEIRKRKIPTVYIPVPNAENQDNYADIQFGTCNGEPVSVAEAGCTALTLYHEWNAIYAGTNKEYPSFRAWWGDTIGATDYVAGNVMDGNTVPKMLEILGWESDGNIPVEGAEQLDILLERLEQGLPTYASIQSANNVGGTHAVLIIGADAARKKLAVLDSHVVGTEGVVSWLSFEDIFTDGWESYDGIDPMDYGVG